MWMRTRLSGNESAANYLPSSFRSGYHLAMRFLRSLMALFVPAAIFLGGCTFLPETLPLPTRGVLAMLPPPTIVAATPPSIVSPAPAPAALPTQAAPTATLFEPSMPTVSPTLMPTSPPPSPTPHPLAGVTLDGLRGRDYPGGPVQILQTLETAATFTRYYIAYPSDGLTIR